MNNIHPTVFLNHDTEKTICEKNRTFQFVQKNGVEYLSGDLTGEKMLSQFLFSGYAISSANVREVCAVNNVRKKHLAEKGNC